MKKISSDKVFYYDYSIESFMIDEKYINCIFICHYVDLDNSYNQEWYLDDDFNDIWYNLYCHTEFTYFMFDTDTKKVYLLC